MLDIIKHGQNYGSPRKVAIDNLMLFYDVELAMMADDLTDTLSPSVKSMEAVQIVLEMQLELAEYIKKNGKNDRLTKSAKRLIKLFGLLLDLNSITGMVNTVKLKNKEIYGKYKQVIAENIELKAQLKRTSDAENF